MADFASNVLLGLSLGAVYGLVGFSFTAIYNTSRIINFFQGEFVMVGAVLTSLAIQQLHLPISVTLLIVILIVGALALGLHRIIIEPLLARGASLIPLMFSTVAAGMVMGGAVGLLTNFSFQPSPPMLGGDQPWHIGDVLVVPQYVIVLLSTALLVLGYWYMLSKSIFGIALRAVGIDSTTACMMGIPRLSVIAFSFLVSGVIAGIGGFLLAPLVGVQSEMGFPLVIKGFIAAVLGGLGNPYGAIVGGFIIGLISILLAGYLNVGYADVVLFCVLLAVLLLRPHGIFGKEA